MKGINWKADDVMRAMLELMSAIEKQDITAELDITATIYRSPSQAEYIGTFWGSTRVNERYK